LSNKQLPEAVLDEYFPRDAQRDDTKQAIGDESARAGSYQPSLTFDFVESLLQSCKLASTCELDDDLYPLSPGLFLRLVFRLWLLWTLAFTYFLWYIFCKQ
jgi:hypothetical protein